MKPKTGFESGSSPTATATVKVSENGAPIQTGHGLEETKRRIMEAFEKIRQHPAQWEPSRVQHPAKQQTPPAQEAYTEQHKTTFHERAKRLSMAALEASHISARPRRAVVCWEITVPSQSAEELIREALGE
jgi:hypothetical protein